MGSLPTSSREDEVLGVALPQDDRCPYKRGSLDAGTDRHTGHHRVSTGVILVRMGDPRARRERGTHPLAPSQGRGPADTCILYVSPQFLF